MIKRLLKNATYGQKYIYIYILMVHREKKQQQQNKTKKTNKTYILINKFSSYSST